MDLIKNALVNIKGHKLRVFMALIWIIIGITSVILISSIGNGLKEEVSKTVTNVGPNKTSIYFESENAYMNDYNIFLSPFTYSDIEELSFIDGVEKIGPTNSGIDESSIYSFDASFDKKTTYIDLSPLKEDSNTNTLYGRSFSLDDEDRNVIMITMQNATDLFNSPEDAIGKGITINGYIFEVIGVLDENYASDMYDTSYNYDEYYNMPTAYVPNKSFENLVKQYDYSTEIYGLDLVASKNYDVFEVANKVIERLYNLHPSIEGTYMTEDLSYLAESQMYELESMTSSINKVVILITFISLFVGGIGVMNVMYVSVMERQREIGIRRAIGAKPRAILIQFLVESICITILGGVLGIIVGLFATNYAANYIPFKAIPSVNSILFASIITILVGVIFGIVPAFKASRLDPIKAIYK
ncbi:ABC transporter permease [Romboutsia sp. Marseille-P6047]|uniref:ABC transporter permease n=1 Tax=Romboutsia sp. Marseille-P6047 TaxID=2161817 RepID=UPI000F054B5E|nr:ABC transporter permease [Romboutsia sp. Marseille-P6047]